jgi:2-polyprenyl-3-methyl-5-hydroxy-6-metoxy-1,4-benzoquinol methylase
MEPIDPAQVEQCYDTVAAAYAERFYHELEHKPFDRSWVDRFADLTRDKGWVCDLGCGPGQIARYLAERGARVCGADLSLETSAIPHTKRKLPRLLHCCQIVVPHRPR